MRVLIENGSHGMRNLGDIAMLQVAVHRLQGLWPHASIDVLTGDDDRLIKLCPNVRPVPERGSRIWSQGLGVYDNTCGPTGKLGKRLNWAWRRLVHHGDLRRFMFSLDQSEVVVASGGGYINDIFEPHAMRVLTILEAAIQSGKLTAMLVMLAVGIPIYVCSTSSIPIALAFMHMGASPGAALVFLVAGPATNAAAIAVVHKILGRRALAVYFLTIAVGALICGYLLDWIYLNLTATGFSLSEHAHCDSPSMRSHLFAVLLLVVLINSLIPRKDTPSAAPLTSDEADEPGMQTLALKIAGMTCAHCVAAVTRALRESPGVRVAEVSLSEGQAVIHGTGLDPANLINTVLRYLSNDHLPGNQVNTREYQADPHPLAG